MASYRITVLECDTPLTPIVKEYGTYGDIFRKFLKHNLGEYARQLSIQAPDVIITSINVVESEHLPDLKAVDCILLTGSKHNSWEDQPWIMRIIEFVRGAHAEESVRMVGICFGHQIIARALGSTVKRNSQGWELSVDQIQLYETGEKLFGTKAILPHGCQNIGYSPKCQIQGLYQPGRVFSVQAHPEFDETIMGAILDMRYEQGVFDDALYAEGKARNVAHDGEIVGVAIWRFLLEM
ncbi:hypothetical protein G7054_g9916 [Neopestalotiopsis clavispora]|nr:hypothetical protein G7054_g9916 [Neopestalotiopsis clavispora]